MNKHSMRVVKNKLKIVEANISKYHNEKRNKEEEEVIDDIKNDPATFYNYAKKYAKTKDTIGPIMDKEGNIHSNSKNIADLLKNQYRSVFSEPRETYNYKNIEYKCGNMEKVYFTRENILKQITKLNRNSSPGPDGIYALCYKYGGEHILDALIDIYNHMREEGYSPQMSREAWIAPV